MLFNTNTTGDPRSFFYFKGDYYINGTEIILTDKYINNHKFNEKKLWKYAKYDHQTKCNGRVAYFFCKSRSDWLSFNEMGIDIKEKDNYAPYFVIEAFDLEVAIEEIAHPIKLERAQTETIMNTIMEPKSDFENTSLTVLWIAYIVVMIGSLIFKQFYILWIVVSVIFFKLRKEMLSK